MPSLPLQLAVGIGLSIAAALLVLRPGVNQKGHGAHFSSGLFAGAVLLSSIARASGLTELAMTATSLGSMALGYAPCGEDQHIFNMVKAHGREKRRIAPLLEV